MRRNSQRLVCPKCRKHHHPRKTGREQTARFCQAVPRGDIRPTCVSARCGWLPRAAISTSREWAAIGEVAPLLLAAGTPTAPHLRIHTINTNRLTALIPRPSSGSFEPLRREPPNPVSAKQRQRGRHQRSSVHSRSVRFSNVTNTTGSFRRISADSLIRARTVQPSPWRSSTTRFANASTPESAYRGRHGMEDLGERQPR